MAVIYIYTDGACSGNPGPGGWGAVIKSDGAAKEISGGERNTTNNKMELAAVINALEQTPEGAEIVITTDSEYVKNGITKWIFAWQKNNWITAAKTPVKNKELWVALLGLTKERQVSWQWVRGHSGHIENERCDALARREIGKITGKPY